MPERKRRVLLTGATGFVGGHAHDALIRAGHEVVCASRAPDAARRSHPERTFRRLDVQQPETLGPALAGCDAAIYLVHGMRGGERYETAELRGAISFRDAAATAGLERIVYLGGVQPSRGAASTHLRSRLETGAALRAGSVPSIELRAAMIIGSGSESFRMVRDLSARLPLMVLPSWSRSRSEPIGVRDVAVALCAALDLDIDGSCVFGIPGPEVLSAREILMRTAKLMGRSPHAVGVPLVTPRLSAYWIRLVTRAHPSMSRELVEGLRSDLLASDPSLWERIGHQPESFDRAVLAALQQERAELSWPSRLLERAVAQAFSKRRRP